MTRLLTLVALAALAALAMPVLAQAPVEEQIPYQGYLTLNGTPVTDPALDVSFVLADDLGGTASESATVAVVDGVFSYRIGTGTAFTGLDFTRPVSLTLVVDPAGANEQIGPVPLGAVPLAQHALSAPASGTAFSLPFSGTGNEQASVFEISNTGSGDGIRVDEAGAEGVEVLQATNGFLANSVTEDGFTTSFAGEHGLSVGFAGSDGIWVNRTFGNGIRLLTVGDTDNDGQADDISANGVLVQSVGGTGVSIGEAGRNGLYVDEAGSNGVQVFRAEENGFQVSEAGENGVLIESSDGVGLRINTTGGRDTLNPLQPLDENGHGVLVRTSGGHGVLVSDPNRSGVRVDRSTESAFHVQTTDSDGLRVANSDQHGVHILNAQRDGVRIASAERSGVQVDRANGLAIYGSGRFGAYLEESGRSGPDLRIGGTLAEISSDLTRESDFSIRSNRDIQVHLNQNNSGEATRFVVSGPRRLRGIDAWSAGLLGAPTLRRDYPYFSVNVPSPANARRRGGSSEVVLPTVIVGGRIAATEAGMTIDHPDAPDAQVLSHASVQSNERLLVYSGSIDLDASGEAEVTLPGYLAQIGTDFRFQLTALRQPMPGLYVDDETMPESMVILGGEPNGRVSWRIEAVRSDAWAQDNPFVVEQDKIGPDDPRYPTDPEETDPEGESGATPSDLGAVPAQR
ncbi:MAG: hypothetical protein AAGK21_08390 [Bacteroidota bacterium]